MKPLNRAGNADIKGVRTLTSQYVHIELAAHRERFRRRVAGLHLDSETLRTAFKDRPFGPVKGCSFDKLNQPIGRHIVPLIDTALAVHGEANTPEPVAE